MKNFFFTMLLLLFTATVETAAATVGLSGRVLLASGPLPEAKVYAYATYADLVADRPAFVSPPADSRGVYAGSIPPGTWYFVARGAKDGREYFSYHGRNPVRIEGGKPWVSFLMTERKGMPVRSEGESAVTGIVTFKGKPVPGAYVSLYKPDTSSFRGIGFRTESATENGRFDIRVPFGRYVVIAKRPQEGKGNRPLRSGDLFCYYADNPLEIRGDESVEIEIPCYPKDERDLFVEEPEVKEAGYFTIPEVAATRKAGVYGRIIDPDGNPVVGIHVLLYRTKQPVFLMYHLAHGTEHAARTDRDGNFFIPLDDSGDYYLVARDALGDGPHRGELYGIYQGNSRHVVAFEKGKEIQGIAVTVSRVMEDVPGLVAAESPATSAPTPPAAGQGTKVAEGMITCDVTWKGDILVTAPVVVKRGATLTVAPGTTVRFARIDRDHNGVGDGEIMVEGRMVAVGTAAKPIVFTSAETKPAVKDWAYVQFLASDADNVLQHCRFRYGFSGVQVHYSTLRIADCEFSDNNEGVHYNTADVTVEHCTFSGNDTAIRFKRLEGTVRITDNVITGNEIGVLFGRQQINAVDFKNLNKPVEFPAFTRNNVFGNHKYGYSMGEGQGLDIGVAGNWWGASTKVEIESTLFDRKSDPSLGEIGYAPFLPAPVAGAGVRRTTGERP